jgi:hypothetical protein
MSFNHTNKNIQCDRFGCMRTTHLLYPGGAWQGWKNVLGFDICPDCRRVAEEKFGADWFNHIELKNINT